MGQVEIEIIGNVRSLEAALAKAEQRLAHLEQSGRRTSRALQGPADAGAGDEFWKRVRTTAGEPRLPVRNPAADGAKEAEFWKRLSLSGGGGGAAASTRSGAADAAALAAAAETRRKFELLMAAADDDQRQRWNRLMELGENGRWGGRTGFGAAQPGMLGGAGGLPFRNPGVVLLGEEDRQARAERERERRERDMRAFDKNVERLRREALDKEIRSASQFRLGQMYWEHAHNPEAREQFKKLRGFGAAESGQFYKPHGAFEALNTQLQNTGMSLFGFNTKLLAVAGGAYTAMAAVQSYTEALKRQGERAQEERLRSDKMQRTAAISAGLPLDKMPNMRNAVFELAQDLAMPEQEVFDFIDSSKRSGMDFETSMGPGARALATVRQALNATDPKKEGLEAGLLPKVLSGILNAEGKPFTPENIRQVGTRMRALYEGQTELQDLPEMSSDFAQFIQAGVAPDEAYAAFGTLRDMGISPGEAATMLRQVSQRMSTAKKSKMKVRELAKLGLKPEDIDMIGEDFTTAIDRLAKGAQSVDKSTANVALVRIFEEYGISAANSLFLPRSSQKMRDYLKKMRDPDDLDQYAEIAQGGPNAQEIREQNRKNFRASTETPEAIADRRLKSAREAYQRRHGEWRTDIQEWLTYRNYAFRRLIGDSPEKASTIAIWNGYGPRVRDEVLAREKNDQLPASQRKPDAGDQELLRRSAEANERTASLLERWLDPTNRVMRTRPGGGGEEPK